MTLDNEDQRASLLALLAQATVPGSQLDAAYQLLQAIRNARLEPGVGLRTPTESAQKF